MPLVISIPKTLYAFLALESFLVKILSLASLRQTSLLGRENCEYNPHLDPLIPQMLLKLVPGQLRNHYSLTIVTVTDMKISRVSGMLE